MKKNRLIEWFSIQRAKNPGRVVLAVILIFNVLFLLLSALIISSFSMTGTEHMGFIEAAFVTITMILDAGCIQFVIADIGEANVALAIICLMIVMIGMISFTGAVIGYITNYISSFIENASAGRKKLRVSGHVVILNWNTRASEIVNDLLYSNQKKKIVILVASGKEEIGKELDERLSDTVNRENANLMRKLRESGKPGILFRYHRDKLRNRLTIVIREGDVYSSKQLHDISLEQAKTVVILGSDKRTSDESIMKGNVRTVKTLMQVADITGADYSADRQKIIVEITDDWTEDLVNRIIKRKQVAGKCNIVPIRINKVLGQLLSQFSLMPELNLAYRELFSNKGNAFYTIQRPYEEDVDFIERYLKDHKHAIPLTYMETKGVPYAYYAAGESRDIMKKSAVEPSGYKVEFNKNYWIERKNVVILGHNSKSRHIMQGFMAFRSEWNFRDSDKEILNIIVIDDKESLEKAGYYKEYPFVTDTVEASIYDRDKICTAIDRFVSANEEDTSILILSDDSVSSENVDSNALAGLVYVQDIISRKKSEDSNFDVESIDVIVEIIDPKHHDIVSSYSVNNVVISNRYISKMITQIGQKEALYTFYTDILTYDSGPSEGEETPAFESKEIYAKKVSRLFDKVPGKCRADEFIRAVYQASVDESLPPEQRNPTIALGYVKPGGKMVLFGGDQSQIKVELTDKDKLIVFSNH